MLIQAMNNLFLSMKWGIFKISVSDTLEKANVQGK